MDDQILDDQTRAEIPPDSFAAGEQPGWKKYFTKKIIISSVLALLAVIGVFWYFLKPGPQNNPTSTNVVLFVKGPAQQASGTEAEYHVIYRNGENADLVGIYLEVLYPSGFKFKSASPAGTSSSGQAFNLPPVKPGQGGEVVIRGKLEGSTGEDKEIKARLHYRLSNFNSEFVVEQSIHTAILPPNLIMEISGPVDVVSGQDSTFTVSYTNVSGQDFDSLAVQLTYPPDFIFTAASVKPTKNNNYWAIPKLATGSSGSINITGSFTGDPTQDKLVMASLGKIINNNFAPQISSTATFKIIPSSISLKITAQPAQVVHLGDSISYKLSYGNQGSIGLSNLVITVNLEGSSLDLTRTSISDAIVVGNTITWKAATLPKLAVLSPNEQGEINFSLNVKNDLSTNLKNQTIIAHAAVTSDEITQPTRAEDSTLKLMSALDLTVDGNYLSGAAPMQVGKTTVFAMTLTLSNLSNDLDDTQVVASLPLPPETWNGVVVPDPEKSRISFDASSGKITWHLGTLPAFTGKFSPVAQVTFQLQVTPTETDRGKQINLLSNVQATGTDNFVNQQIQTPNVSSVTTGSIDDQVLNVKGTSVK